MSRDSWDLCRDLGHSWSLRSTSHSWTAGAMYEQSLQCTACGTMRHRWLDRGGYVLRTWYTYPEGYLTPGEGRMTAARRARYRLRNIKP